MRRLLVATLFSKLKGPCSNCFFKPNYSGKPVGDPGGKKKFCATLAGKLGKFFGVSAALFVPRY